MKILIILLVFNLGFVSGAAVNAYFKDEFFYLLYMAAVIALAIVMFFENLPTMIANLFRSKPRRKRIEWDPTESTRGWCD